MDESQQAALAALASKATYWGSGATVASWIASFNWGVIGGLAVGVTGLLVNWYYTVKRDRREQVEHERRMSK